jgi:ankyrin repeat protein
MNFKTIVKIASLAVLALSFSQAALGMEVEEDQTPNELLLNAIGWDNAAQVVQSLHQGADINCKDETGDTPLIIASKKGYTKIVQLLLDHGAHIDSKSKWGWTPLIAASSKGCFKIVQMLLNHGADIHCISKIGKTALDFANSYKHNDIALLIHDAIQRKKQVSLNKLLTFTKDSAAFSDAYEQAKIKNTTFAESIQEQKKAFNYTFENNLALLSCGLDRK